MTSNRDSITLLSKNKDKRGNIVERHTSLEEGESATEEAASDSTIFSDEEFEPDGAAVPPTDPARHSAIAAVSTLALATAACGGGATNGGGAPPPTGGTPTPTALMPQTDAEAARFALQAGLSVSTGDIMELRSEGFESWLNREIDQPIQLTAQQFFADRNLEDINEDQFFFRPDLADYMIWNQLFTGQNSVRKRVALALSEFFVVSLNALTLWPSTAIGTYWDVLVANAFGNFRDLLEEITLNSAMGVFLNTLGNQRADPDRGRVPDENFGREVMQLFSIGLFELNIDGTLQTDANGDPIETYDNDDVTGIAKAFTGYHYSFEGDVEFTEFGSDPVLNIPDARLVRNPMTADPDLRLPFGVDTHSLAEKSFLGTTIPAETDATETLRITMDTLFNHANVGPFFGRQMIQRLVTSNPSPAYVQRVAEAFNDNGSGVRGDLAAVFRAILLDDEALSETTLNDPGFGKLREPMLRFAQWGRTFGAESGTNLWLMQDISNRSNRLGQAPLRSPSVFNYFRPGFIPPNSQAADNDLVAPEFQIVNETTAAGYLNFMERSIDGTGPWMFDIKATYQEEIPIAHDPTALLDQLDLLLTANQLSEFSRDTILAALNSTPVAETDNETTKLAQIYRAVMLVMSSNDYLVQK